MKSTLTKIAAAILAVAVVSSARAEKNLAVVLDVCRRNADAAETTISYFNTLLQGFEKDPARQDVSVTLVQLSVERNPKAGGVRLIQNVKTVSVGGGGGRFKKANGSPLKDSPISYSESGIGKLAQSWILEFAKKSDGIVLVSSDPAARAVNLGERFHRVVVSPLDARRHFDAAAFTTRMQTVVEEFLSYNSNPEFRFSVVTGETLTTGGKATFRIEAQNVDSVSVTDGTQKMEFSTGLAKKTFDLSFPKAGSFVVVATPVRKGQPLSPVKVTIRVEDPKVAEVSRLVANPARGWPGADIDFDILLVDAKTAAVDFGDGTKAEHRVGAPLRHAFDKPGDYTVTVAPEGNGKKKTTEVKILPPAVRNASIAPEAPSTATDVIASFFVEGAPAASVDFGDGSKPVVVKVPAVGSVSASHRYAKEGAYSVRIVPENGNQRFSAVTVPVVVVRESVVPAIVFSPLRKSFDMGSDGLCAVEFTLSLQNAAKARIDFGDGSPIEEKAPGTVTHDYAALGSYKAMATALSDDGVRKEKTCQVEVVEPEVPSPSCTVSAEETATMGAVHDIECQFFNTESATVTFSDDEGAEPTPVEIDEAGGATIRHAFRDSGEASATITMVNGKKTETKTVPVSVARPEETFGSVTVLVDGEPADGGVVGDISIKVGQEVTIQVKQINVLVTVDYGDGTVEHGATTSHTYLASGDYDVTIRGKGKFTSGKKAPRTLTIRVKGSSSLPVVLGILVLLGVGGFGGFVALKPKKRLKVSQSGKDGTTYSFGVFSRSRVVSLSGVQVRVLLGKSEIKISSPAPNVTADGKRVPQKAPGLAVSRLPVAIATGRGNWTIDLV